MDSVAQLSQRILRQSRRVPLALTLLTTARPREPLFLAGKHSDAGIIMYQLSHDCCRFFNISLSTIRREVAKARRTLVTIQFGHNDERIAPPASMGANLTVMIKHIRAIGGEPVLVTPLARRGFRADGTIYDSLASWAKGSCFRFCITSVYVLTFRCRNHSYFSTTAYTSARSTPSFGYLREDCRVERL